MPCLLLCFLLVFFLLLYMIIETCMQNPRTHQTNIRYFSPKCFFSLKFFYLFCPHFFPSFGLFASRCLQKERGPKDPFNEWRVGARSF